MTKRQHTLLNFGTTNVPEPAINGHFPEELEAVLEKDGVSGNRT